MNDQLELMRAWLVDVLASHANSEAPAEIAQLSSSVLISRQKETNSPLVLQSPVSFTLTRSPKVHTFVLCQGHQLTISWHNSEISTVYYWLHCLYA